MMDSLMMSRMKKDVSPAKLHNLSPDKYGKAAWADLSYTPCKLADNVLYRQATTMKKNQEGSNRLRQFEAMNSFMRQRMTQLEEQRDGIEKSLNQQVTMYKKMLHDSEIKHQARLKQIQKRFSSQIAMLITQKEEEAKFSQAQKQILEQRILDLEQRLRESQDRQAHINHEYGGMKGHKQKLELQVEHMNQNLCRLQKDRVIEQDQWKRKEDDMKRSAINTERSYEGQLQHLMNEKLKEKDAMERLMRTELEKLENIRMSEGLRKTQQMRDVKTTFDAQTKRLNEIVAMKDRMLESLAYENATNKENLLTITGDYETKVHSLTHQRNDLSMQVEKQLNKANDLQALLQNEMTHHIEERDHLGKVIVDLKDKLQRTEVNYVRDRDRYEHWGTDMEKQNILLKTQNKKIAQVLQQNNYLSNQLNSLRSLLMQSSYEIDRSKQELIRISYEKDSLAMKFQKVMADNQTMYRVNREVQENNTAMKFRNHYTQRSIYM